VIPVKEVNWIKVKVPDGVGAISHDGKTYVAHGGETDVPDTIVDEVVKLYGCKPASAPAAVSDD
jgi:hypothetical protein